MINMKKKSFMKFLIISMIVFLPFIIAVSPHPNQANVNRGSGGCGQNSCHTDQAWHTLSTNYSSDKIDIQQGNTFDIQITISGIQQTTKAVGFGMWHTGSDSMGVPVAISGSSGTLTERSSEWNDAVDYYYGAWWDNAGGSTFVAVFRITPSNSVTTEYLYIQSAAKGGDSSAILTFIINVTAVVADTTAPSVSITSPSNNSYVSGASVAITGTATDSGSGILGSSVEAYVTNTIGTNNTISLSYTGPSYSGTWDSTSVFDGDYNITVRAQDNDGNTNVTEYVTVKVDNTAPIITLESVIPDPSNGITTITASNSSSDIDGNGIRANITDPSLGEIYVNLNYQGSNSWNGSFTVIQNGNYDININATDYAGNTGYDGPVSITGDVETPIISIVSVLPNPSNGVTMITASNSSADIDVNGIWATVTTPNLQSIHVDLTYQGGNIWNGTFTVAENGIYSVNINATDNANNTGYAGPVDITGDIMAPQVNIENPTNTGDQIGGSTISIRGSAYGTGSKILNLYINDSRWGISIDPSGSASGAFIFNNNTNIPIGFYWVAINITDQAGNVNVSYRYFEVVGFDIFPPILIITSINPNPSNGYTEITVTSTEDLISSPLLNITAPNASVYYRPMMLINTRTWRANYTVKDS